MMNQFPLFETLAIIDGEIQHIEYHQQRYEYAIKNYFKATPSFLLADIIKIPNEFLQGKVRCRIDYNAKTYHIHFFHYQTRKIRHFSFAFVENLDYQFKYSDRIALEQLKSPTEDEVIIINNGFVSDCTIGNLLFLKEGIWYSPQHYLLKGTQLTYLLNMKKVFLINIHYDDLKKYEKVMMINALNPFDLSRAIDLHTI